MIKFFSEIINRATREEIMPIIQDKILEGFTTIYTDGWKAYNGLILNRYDHYRIFHHENGVEFFIERREQTLLEVKTI